MKLNFYRWIAVFALIHYAISIPLDIVAGKSGEQQVKEALDKAEKESEQAAKERESKSTDKLDKQETENFLNSLNKDIDLDSNTNIDKNTRSSTDLKTTLDKKVEELAKFHEKHASGKSGLGTSSGAAAAAPSSSLSTLTASVETQKDSSNKLKVMSELIKHEKDSALEALKSAEKKEKENAALEEESDKKMVEMAKKLNNLVVKFQNKMGRLSHRPKNAEELVPEKEDNGESTVKSIRGKPATRTTSDLAALRNALGLMHTKPAKTEDPNTKTSYKEDTKLEDRLAMEAEEEKKFSNGDTYDDGAGGEDDGSKSSSSSSAAGGSTTSSLSPKEQASQEMQNYNALISSESNRELSQIQEEITKATQSSMGQVSVVGQKENVNTEAPPGLPGLPGLSDSSLSLGGGTGSIDASSLTGGGSLGGAGLGGGGLSGASLSGGSLGGGGAGGLGSLGGSSPTELTASSLQSLSSGGLGGLEQSAAQGSEISSQQTSTMTSEQPQGAQQMPGSNPVNLGEQAPIEIGGSQTPVEMGTLGAGQNPFQGLGGGQSNPLEGLQTDQAQQSFMSQQGGAQQPMELGGQMGGAGEQQQSMAFKKSKISNSRKQRTKGNSKKRHSILRPKIVKQHH